VRRFRELCENFGRRWNGGGVRKDEVEEMRFKSASGAKRAEKRDSRE
jgi:hypothetical protein